MDNLNSFPSYLDYLFEGCVITNSSRTIVYMNKQAGLHFRVDKQEYIGKEISKLLLKADHNNLYSSFENSLKSNNSIELEQQLKFNDIDQATFLFRIETVPQGKMLLSVDITHQKNAENLLNEKDAEFHKNLDELYAVINAMPGIVTVVDTEFRVLYTNEAGYNKFGKKSFNEILGKTCYSVRKGFKEPCPHCSLIDAFKDGQPKVRLSIPEEEKIVGFATKAYAIPLFDENGKLWGGVEVIIDIDDMRLANIKLEKLNQELKGKNRFIQTILDNIPIGVALNKIDNGQTTYTNKKFEEIYGWSFEEMCTVQDFFIKVFPDPDSRKKLSDQIMNDIGSGDPAKMHWENLVVANSNGTTKIINAFNIPFYEQNTMVSTVIDITPLKDIEKALSETNELLSKFITNSPIYVYIKEVTPGQSRVIMASENFLDMIGLPGSQMTGKTMEELFPPDFAEKITADDWIVVSNGKTIKLDEELNGRYYTTIKFPIRLGKRDLLAGYTIDITDQKQSEIMVNEKNEALLKANRELKKAKQKAEESDRLKSAFLANMSHEIRTPMNSIMGFASLLPEEDSRELMMNYANIIVRSSEQLVHIIDDIVLYSRLQTRLLSYIPSKFVVKELLSDVKQMFSLPDYQLGVELIVEPGEMLSKEIETDYEKLRQVFTNLISNAFKYTETGNITIGCKKLKDKHCFFVSDTGMGIPEGENEKIFERFYRGSNVNKGKIGGTGLGLSIVKELTELLGGKIWVENNITGKDISGCTFYFTTGKR